MSSMPMYQQPPPVTVAQQQSYNNGASQHDSIGPLIGVLVVIIVLGVIAVMIGRLCSGRRIMGHGQYDIESWAERKCSTCIDGRINVSVQRASESSTSLPATPIDTRQETRQQAEQSSQSQNQNSPPPNC